MRKKTKKTNKTNKFRAYIIRKFIESIIVQYSKIKKEHPTKQAIELEIFSPQVQQPQVSEIEQENQLIKKTLQVQQLQVQQPQVSEIEQENQLIKKTLQVQQLQVQQPQVSEIEQESQLIKKTLQVQQPQVQQITQNSAKLTNPQMRAISQEFPLPKTAIRNQELLQPLEQLKTPDQFKIIPISIEKEQLTPSMLYHIEEFKNQKFLPAQSQRFTQKIPSEKLLPLLKDPRILSIECPGQGRNIIVYKDGTTQTTPYILDEEEIKEIMENLSEQTKIPIVQGVFKASMSDLIITAVISEFVGTRFVIEKRLNYPRQLTIPVPKPITIR